MEMRQCGLLVGREVATDHDACLAAGVAEAAAGRLMLTKMKLVCESVALNPICSNALTVNAFTAVLRARSWSMCAWLPSATVAAAIAGRLTRVRHAVRVESP